MTFEMPEITIGFYIAIIFIILFIFIIIYIIKNKDNNVDISYDGTNKDIISQDKYGRVFVDVSVDSQNGFGAMIRTNFGIVLYPHNNEYKITDCGVCKYSFYKTEDVIKRINNWNKPL